MPSPPSSAPASSRYPTAGHDPVSPDPATRRRMNNIFSHLPALAQTWNRQGDRELAADGLTTRQWMLLHVVADLASRPPSLSTAAERMGTSHQNVKQLALRLQENDLVALRTDPRDRRTIRLEITGPGQALLETRAQRDREFIGRRFTPLSSDEIERFCDLLLRLIRHAGDLDPE